MTTMKDRAPINDRRISADRRRLPTPFFSQQTIFGGRRKTTRREKDRRKHIFLDSYGLRLFITLLLLLILSVSDAYLTLTLVKVHKAAELNPIMAFYLEQGNVTFFLGKFLFTSVAVFVFCIFNHFAVVRISLTSAIVIYLCLVYYELNLMYGVLR